MNITHEQLEAMMLEPTRAFDSTFLPAILTLATLLSLFFRWHGQYLQFKSLGPGGTPPTVAGFVRVQLLSLFALSNPFEQHLANQTSDGYITSLPHRDGNRPITAGIAPQRQMDQRASTSIREALLTGMTRLGHVVDVSCFEKHGAALFAGAPSKETEICHLHNIDGSMHVVLHPCDANAVLEAGWGERHPLARGGWFERFVPAEFVLLYAPRDEREIGTVLEIVQAAARHVRNTCE